MIMPGRKYNAGSTYRYGFNGQEKSDDVVAGIYTSEYWEYDSRIGKRWNTEPLAAKYPHLSPYATFNNSPIMYGDPNGADWILATGNKVYWYGGKYGDRSIVIKIYKATSGVKMATFSDGTKRNLQYANEQNIKGGGPTVEGKYKLNLIPDPDRKAEIDTKSGTIVRNKDGGIESLENMTDPNKPGVTFNSPAWGKNRVPMIPIDVKQPNVTPTKDDDRDLTSFYFHDSEKGESHGCHEVETDFFTRLKEYRAAGNKSIEVQVKYTSKKQSTNGGTEKKKETKVITP